MKSAYKDLLHERNFVKTVLATFITRIGDGIDMVAFSWLIYDITGSTALVATICGVNMIPNITIGLISGGLCNYISEKTIMWVCDFGRGLCVSLIAFLYLTQQLEVWHLFVVCFLISTFEAFRSPAQSSIFPKILTKEKQEQGLAIEQSIVGIANLIGLACGPVCIGLFGLSGAIFIDAFSFFLCGGIILLLRGISATTQEHALTAKTYLNELKEGFQYTRKDNLLVSLCIFACLINAMAVPIIAFEAPYIKDYLQMGSEGIAILGVCQVLGMILISPLLPKLKEKICYRNMVILGGALAGLIYLLYAFLPQLSGVAGYVGLATLSFSMGTFLAMVNFPVRVAVFGRVEQAYLARFMSVMTAMCMAAQPFASFIFGIISKSVALNHIYLLCGIIMTLLFISQIYNKVLNQLNDY